MLDNFEKRLQQSQVETMNAAESRLANYYLKSQPDVNEDELKDIIREYKLHKIARGEDGDPMLATDLALDILRRKKASNGVSSAPRAPRAAAAPVKGGSMTPSAVRDVVTAEEVAKARENGTYDQLREKALAFFKSNGGFDRLAQLNQPR